MGLVVRRRIAIHTARGGRGRVIGRVGSLGNAQRLSRGGSHNRATMLPAQIQGCLRSSCHLMHMRMRKQMMLLLLLATAAYGTHVALLALVLAVVVVVVHVDLRRRHIDILVRRIDYGATIFGHGMIGRQCRHLLLLLLLLVCHIAIRNGGGNSVDVGIGIGVCLMLVKTFNATCKQLRFRIMRYHCGGSG